MSKLTLKQEKFCQKYIETGNASEAYRYAYDCSRWTDKSVWEKASQMLTNVKVSARVEELKAELKDKSDIKKEELLKELANIAFSSIASIHKTWTELKDFEKLTDVEKACIKTISTKVLKRNIGTRDEPDIIDVEYVKIEMHDKLKAIDSISKMLGYDAADKVDITSGGKTIKTEPTEVIFRNYDERDDKGGK